MLLYVVITCIQYNVEIVFWVTTMKVFFLTVKLYSMKLHWKDLIGTSHTSMCAYHPKFVKVCMVSRNLRTEQSFENKTFSPDPALSVGG